MGADRFLEFEQDAPKRVAWLEAELARAQEEIERLRARIRWLESHDRGHILLRKPGGAAE